MKSVLIIKRVFDLTMALLALLLLWPLLLIIALVIRAQSPGPVFYRGIRTGLNGISFRIFKFRTMVANAERIGGPSTALNDPRLTPIGKFLRKYKLDELPQLFNIIKGEMSFVGPRPQVEMYTSLYLGEEKLILTVKPGLTDYASIHFINLDALLGDKDVNQKYLLEIEPQKNMLRTKYAKENSFWIDMKILCMTTIQMLKIRSKWNIGN
jgi:lipopolysaccharide/colanic/teichoic acid biosynthesis glycosyltransferase